MFDLIVSVALALSPESGVVASDRRRYCEGFEDGWESVLEHYATPFCPFTPYDAGPNYYASGFRDGVRKACRDHPERC